MKIKFNLKVLFDCLLLYEELKLDRIFDITEYFQRFSKFRRYFGFTITTKTSFCDRPVVQNVSVFVVDIVDM
jgi:hypothetical protein